MNTSSLLQVSSSPIKKTSFLLQLTPSIENKTCGVCKEKQLGSKRTQKQGICSKCLPKIDSARGKCKFSCCENYFGYGTKETFFYCPCSKFLCSQHRSSCKCNNQNGVTYSEVHSQEFAKRPTKVVDLSEPKLQCFYSETTTEQNVCHFCQKRKLVGEWQKQYELLCCHCQKELKTKINFEEVKVGQKVGMCAHKDCPIKISNSSHVFPLEKSNCSKGHPITHFFLYYVPQNVKNKNSAYRSNFFRENDT